MQLELIPRTSQEMYQGCWLIPNAVNLEQQNCLLGRCREWGKGRIKTHVLPSGLKMNHPFFCVGHNWKPYQYYSGDVDFPEYLSKLAFDILQRIAPSYISDWNMHSPDTAIINWYPPGSSLALHQDNSESSQLIALGSPIVTIAIGDTAKISVGGFERSGQRKFFEMRSGDAFLLFGSSRTRFHSVEKIYPGTAPPGLNLKQEDRISITMRRVFM